MRVTEKERSLEIKKSLQAYKETNEKRTLDIQFRGQQRNLPVVRLTTSMLLLNHNNNRLSAQLDGHPSENSVQSNPTSQESQIALQKLLSATKEFNVLKTQLKDLGQHRPGLCTREGLLIDGNTRLTALIELEKEGSANGMDIAILPEDVNLKDLLDIEVNLQMTDLVHQKYSFTNELLMMKRVKVAGASDKELAKKLGWIRGGEKKVGVRMRILSIIEEVRNISNPLLPWAAFDKKEELFKNIDEAYQALKGQGDLKGAEAIKWSRIVAMFVGLNKDQVRAIDEDFFQEQIIDSRLEDSDETSDLKEYLESFQSASINDDPGGFFPDDEEDNFGYHAKALFKDLIASDQVRDDQGDIKPLLDGHALSLGEILRNAARAKILAENQRTERQKPTAIIKEVRLNLEDIKSKIPELSSDPDFKSTDFTYEVNKLKKLVNDISALRERFMQ